MNGNDLIKWGLKPGHWFQHGIGMAGSIMAGNDDRDWKAIKAKKVAKE